MHVSRHSDDGNGGHLKIAAFAQDRGACTGYRVKQPADKIRKLGLCDCYTIGPYDPKTEDVVKASDVVFLGRAGDLKALDLIKRMKMMGKKVVYDLDDSLFDVSPYSPHYKDLGVMPVNVDMDYGDRIDMWVDGHGGFDLKQNRKIRRYFVEIIREADAITCTTPTLVELYSKYNDRVRMVPNAIDFDLWRYNKVYTNDKKYYSQPRVIYPAGSNHQEDWFFIRPILEEVQKAIPDWILVLMGVDWKGQQGNLDMSRVLTTPWVDFEAYPMSMYLSCGDIGIAPISDIAFNDCRSSVKWMEYAAIGAATVASNRGPYARDCTHGVDAMLCNSKEEWIETLKHLIWSEKKKEIAGNALAKVKKEYNLDFMADRWMEVFREVNES